MMGERTVMQESLFYGFSLERHVPSDHMPRKIDRFVDLSGTWAHWVGIRPERRFCDEVHLNLAYRWFCRFHDSDLFRQRLETVVARCAGGGGEAFAVDPSMIVADAYRQSGVKSSRELASTSNLTVRSASGNAPAAVMSVMENLRS
jgi:hypothetical protein